MTGGGSGALASGFAAYGASRAAQNVYEYEKMGNAAQAVGLWTDAQREALESYAQELNRDFPFTNKDILSAAFELNRAGQTFAQTMGSLRSTLNVSLAGDLGLQETADIMTNVAQAMRLPIETAEQTAETMKRVGDTLAYAATNSNTDIAQMGIVFKYVAPLAAATGMSLEEMASASMILANNGIKASNAGTGLRFALTRILKPSKEALKAFDRLNINIGEYIQGARQIRGGDVVSQLSLDGIDASEYVAQIDAILQDPAIKKAPAKLVAAISDMLAEEMGTSLIDRKVLSDTLSDTLTVLGTQIDFRGLIRTLRDNPEAEAVLPAIFGVRHGAKIMALLAQDLDAAVENLQGGAGGAADKMSRIRTKGVVGDWMEFVAVVDNLTMTLAKSGLLADASQALTALTVAIDKLAESGPGLLSIGAKAFAAAALIAPLGWIASGVAGAVSALAIAAGAVATPLGLAALALGGFAFVFFKNNWAGMREFGKSFQSAFVNSLSPETIERWKSIKNAVSSFISSSDSLSVATETWRSWGRAMGDVAAAVADGIERVISMIESLVAKIKSIGSIQLPSIYGGTSNGLEGAAGRRERRRTRSEGRPVDGARAAGGPVRRGLTYLVGEQGPELLTAGFNGFVTPNHAVGDSINIRMTNHINSNSPREIAQEISRILDHKLRRSRSGSINGRKAVGGF